MRVFPKPQGKIIEGFVEVLGFVRKIYFTYMDLTVLFLWKYVLSFEYCTKVYGCT